MDYYHTFVDKVTCALQVSEFILHSGEYGRSYYQHQKESSHCHFINFQVFISTSVRNSNHRRNEIWGGM